MITLPFTTAYGDDGSGTSPTNYAPYLTMAGGGFQGLSQLMAGRDSASLLRANAGIAGLEAKGEVQAGAEQAQMYRQRLSSAIGRQQAQIGGANVTMSGSALRGLERTSEIGAQDIARIQTNAARKAWGFQTTEAGDLVRADLASGMGRMGALGSLITTGARAYGSWAGS